MGRTQDVVRRLNLVQLKLNHTSDADELNLVQLLFVRITVINLLLVIKDRLAAVRQIAAVLPRVLAAGVSCPVHKVLEGCDVSPIHPPRPPADD